jgi:sulfur carrier protein
VRSGTGQVGAGAFQAEHEGPVRVVVNGRQHEFPAGSTLADVVAVVAPDARGVAVAVAKEVVPRSGWDAFVVRHDADVEIVSAAAGG